MPIPGSEILGRALHAVGQSLLIPDLIGLLILLFLAFLSLGGFLAEHRQRRLGLSLHPGRTAENRLPTGAGLCRRAAELVLAREELRLKRELEKTDLIAKLGPMLGLMGTLIPLGPGLAALGQGDVATLAQAVIVAFDTTVAGLAAGGIAYVISRVRRRWYREYLADLEAQLEEMLEGGNKDAAPARPEVAVRR